jgi:hypothetical protein
VNEDQKSTLSYEWLCELYQNIGLDASDVDSAAERTWRRLVTRTHRTNAPSKSKRQDLRSAMVADPMVSFHRITGTGLSGLPFYDEERNILDAVEFTFIMRDAGLTSDVALVFAKVVVEMMTPEQFFGPIWTALGQRGPLDLEELRRMDWSPLRDGLDLGVQEGGAAQREKSKSHLNRPLLSRSATDPVVRSIKSNK